jgi:tRNA uridine 5-carboxymethylaminomethyl modification enzyme
MKKQVEIQVKYDGYIIRQMEMAERLKKVEGKKIPDNFDYQSVNGLSREVLMKLLEVKPINLGQASRIPGVTPAAISLLMVAVEKLKRERTNKKSQASG